jgi:O-antigen/teichoic acid export membrane protein
VVSSGLTSALGLIYWLVAARNYSAVAVGVGSALIAAMTTIADLCHLNLKSALNRFLPSAGSTTKPMVVRSYLVALVISGAVSVGFVVGLNLWSPRLVFLKDRPELGLWFVLSTMAWTLFVLQDSVLTGIRQAVWVPVENLVYSIVKLVLLLVLVVAAPELGTFVAWTAALPLLVVPVNLLLFRWLLPAHARATRAREERVGVSGIARYVASDYVAYLFVTATMGLLPLIVLAVLGAKANAYYFVSWSIAYGLYLIASGMGMSMITEAAHDPAGLAGYRRQSLVESARLMVPCVALVVVAAPWILGLLGNGYASSGATLLRLLSLSALPWIVFVTYTNCARVQRRMRVVVLAYGALCGLVLAIGLPLLRPLGIDGLGVGWLAAQSIVATAILAVQLAGRSRGELSGGVIRALSAARRRWRGLPRPASVRTQRRILTELRMAPDRSGWVAQRNLAVLNDVAVSAVGPPGSAPAAVVKRARSQAGQRALWPNARAIQQLRRIPGVDGWRALVPRLLGSGVAGHRGYTVESYMPGTTMESMLRRGGDSAQLLEEAAAAIKPLHDATTTSDVVDATLLRELVEVPVERLLPVVARHSRLGDSERALERLRHELRTALGGRTATTTWIHGDLSPGNILMGDAGTVQGIVDWEQGQARGLPQLDLLQLLISVRMTVERRELGDVIAELHPDPAWRPHERRVADAIAGRDCSVRPGALVLLAWLKHVSANIGKSDRYAKSGLWVRRNIDPVLASLMPEPAPAFAPGSPRPDGVGSETATPLLRRWRALPATRLGLAPWLGTIGLAVALWVFSLPHIDPRAMTDLGLISVLPFTFVLALLVLTMSFLLLLRRGAFRSWPLAMHVLALVAFIHATPAIVYGTLRYSWAWKHVGIVDYIARHGGVDPGIRFLPVYHNWPGFFGLDTLLTKLAGLPDTLALASWGPVFNNVLYLGALLFLFSGLTRDRRVVWLACWLFFIANWVGQDYFSPQAFAFLLYLLLLGVVVRWLSPASPLDRPGRRAAICLSVLLIAAIAPSHALTSVMTCIALTALVLARVCDARALPFIAVAVTGIWDLVFAWDYAGHNLASTLDQIRLPWATTSSSLTNVGRLSADQALVANVARGLSIGIIALAMVGAVRQMRGGKLGRAAVVLAAAPVVLFATGNYDGEILFRIYLFAVPFLTYLAAHAFVGVKRPSAPIFITTVAVTLVLGTFLVAYYGKERSNYFTPQEVSAARYVDTHAPPGSLLIDGTNNYPYAFKNYERFVYVSISLEPPDSQARVLQNPVGVLSAWMGDRSYRAAYLILTRSQSIDVEANGAMRAGSLTAIERALLSSPRFRVVFHNRDATVFTLAPPARGSVGG